MRLLIFLWFAVEAVQVLVIAMLVVGYRKLQRTQDQTYRFANRPPRSVTDEN